VAPHWPRGVHGAVTDQNSVSSGERSDRVRPFKPFCKTGRRGRGRAFPPSSFLHSRHDDAAEPRRRRPEPPPTSDVAGRLVPRNTRACGTARRSERLRGWSSLDITAPRAKAQKPDRLRTLGRRP
jgi:hypothetical protein